VGRIQYVGILEREKWQMCVPGCYTSKLFAVASDSSPTFYTRHGDVPFALPSGIMAAGASILVMVQEGRRMKLKT